MRDKKKERALKNLKWKKAYYLFFQINFNNFRNFPPHVRKSIISRKTENHRKLILQCQEIPAG